MKFSIVLSNSKYAKFVKAYNQHLPFTCKGFNIDVTVSNNDTDLFSISNGVSEIYININDLGMNFYNDYVFKGDNCMISIRNINPVDITLKTKTVWANKKNKIKKIFNFSFK